MIISSRSKGIRASLPEGITAYVANATIAQEAAQLDTYAFEL
jgi:hypothetical protein